MLHPSVHLEVWIQKNSMPWKKLFRIQVDNEIFDEDWLECFATEFLDAKYEKTDAAEVVKGLSHLNAHQKADFL